MTDRDRKLQVQSDGRDPNKIALAFQNIGSNVVPDTMVLFAASGEVSNVINVNLQVTDRLKQIWEGRWPLLVWVTPTPDGDPDPTGNTVGIVSPGATFASLIPGAAYLMLTGPQGQLPLQITVAGAATRYIYASMNGRSFNSGPIAWT